MGGGSSRMLRRPRLPGDSRASMLANAILPSTTRGRQELIFNMSVRRNRASGADAGLSLGCKAPALFVAEPLCVG